MPTNPYALPISSIVLWVERKNYIAFICRILSIFMGIAASFATQYRCASLKDQKVGLAFL